MARTAADVSREVLGAAKMLTGEGFINLDIEHERELPRGAGWRLWAYVYQDGSAYMVRPWVMRQVKQVLVSVHAPRRLATDKEIREHLQQERQEAALPSGEHRGPCLTTPAKAPALAPPAAPRALPAPPRVLALPPKQGQIGLPGLTEGRR